MPFKSRKQAAWMFANKPRMARKWAAHTRSINSLPRTARSRRRRGRGSKRR